MGQMQESANKVYDRTAAGLSDAAKSMNEAMGIAKSDEASEHEKSGVKKASAEMQAGTIGSKPTGDAMHDAKQHLERAHQDAKIQRQREAEAQQRERERKEEDERLKREAEAASGTTDSVKAAASQAATEASRAFSDGARKLNEALEDKRREAERAQEDRQQQKAREEAREQRSH